MGEATDRAGAEVRGGGLRLALALVAGVTAWRVAQLFLSPLELYPDEAQYWLWSRTLDWGYFSKPPVIAWAIAATTALGGDSEAWVRLPAPLFHAMAAASLAMAARTLFDGRTALFAAAVYLLMPGVALSSQVIATDAPLLAFLGLAAWALAALWRCGPKMGPETGPGTGEAGRPAGGVVLAAAAGAALGAAALSKYAAFYAVGGLLLHAAADREGRARLWTPARAMAAAGAFLLVLAPNLAWNALHGFQTVAHTAADADLGEDARGGRGLHLVGGLAFLGGQFGVFGPAPFAALAWVGVRIARRRGGACERWLFALAIPALAIVLGEAVVARANANWAGAAYASGSILAASAVRWSGRWRAALVASLALQAAVAAAFSLAMVRPDLVERAGLGNTMKRAQGWRATAAIAHTWRDRAAASGPLTALAVDDRFTFNALAYYGRDWIAARGAPPLRMWLLDARAHTQAETAAPLTPALGDRVAFVSDVFPDETRADFARVGAEARAVVPLNAGARIAGPRRRQLLLFVGEGFRPRPRDPATGRPRSP